MFFSSSFTEKCTVKEGINNEVYRISYSSVYLFYYNVGGLVCCMVCY